MEGGDEVKTEVKGFTLDSRKTTSYNQEERRKKGREPSLSCREQDLVEVPL